MTKSDNRVADKDWGADFRKLSAGAALVGLTLWLDHMQASFCSSTLLMFSYPVLCRCILLIFHKDPSSSLQLYPES